MSLTSSVTEPALLRSYFFVKYVLIAVNFPVIPLHRCMFQLFNRKKLCEIRFNILPEREGGAAFFFLLSALVDLLYCITLPCNNYVNKISVIVLPKNIHFIKI